MTRPQLCVIVVVALGLMMTSASFADNGPGRKAYVELARPQSDDQGHYVPVGQHDEYPVIGFVAAEIPVARVVINGTEATIFDAQYHCYGAPGSYKTMGFRVPLLVDPDTLLVVVVTLANKDEDVQVFHPDRDVTLARLKLMHEAAEQVAYEQLRLANAYACEARYEECFPLYEHICLAYPRFYYGCFFGGLARFDCFDYDAGLVWFDNCLLLEPDFFLCYYERGRYWGRRGRWDYAEREFRHALEHHPRFAEGHWRLGEALSHQGHWQGAIDAYHGALHANNRFAPAAHSLGLAYQHQGNWSGAGAALRQATTLNPRSAQFHTDLAATYAHQSQWRDAVPEYRAAVRLNPWHGDAHMGLAHGMYNMGQYNHAWEETHAAQSLGVHAQSGFLRQLGSKMPEPKYQGYSPSTGSHGGYSGGGGSSSGGGGGGSHGGYSGGGGGGGGSHGGGGGGGGGGGHDGGGHH